MGSNRTGRRRRYYRGQHWWSRCQANGCDVWVETTLGMGEGSAIWTRVPTPETDRGVVLQTEVPELNPKLEV